ncbi:phosphatase PAP2 family protein, partial [bacterium]|nr:phosphatase PAP2 family protein [bacterium]
ASLAKPTDIALSATSIAEKNAAGAVIGSFTTTDADGGRDRFTYTLVSGTGATDNASFTVDGSQLKAAASFDYEAKNSYAIRVRATDAGGLSTEKAFTITVTNVNEALTQAPVADGYLVGAKVFADADNDRVLDWIDGNENKAWDPGEGEVWTTTDQEGNFSFDFGDPSATLRTVGGIDKSTGLAFQGQLTAPPGSKVVNPLTTLVAATIAANPGIAPADAVAKVRTGLGIPGEIDLTTYDPIKEQNVEVQKAAAKVANLIVAAVQSGIDQSAVVANIAATVSQSATAVNLADAGVLQTVLTVNAAPPPAAAVTNLASDNGAVDAAETLDDIAKAQKTSQSVQAAVAENVSVANPVFQAPAAGLVNPTFTLDGADKAFFTVDAGGAVRMLAEADYETRQTYQFTVVAADSTGSSSTTSVTLRVTDVNEAPTAVALQSTTTSLPENTSTASRVKVADIAVTDDALGTNAITLSGADAASFEVAGTSLYLKAGVALNYEAQTSYAVTVNVGDAWLPGSSPLSVSYALSVTDVNDLAPVITSGPTGTVEENAPIATAIYTAAVTDGDGTDPNKAVTYSLKDGGDKALLDINATTGVVTLKTSADYETKSSYAFTVVATNTAVPALFAEKAVIVSVTDVNEPPTAMALKNAIASLPENTNTTSRVKLADIDVTDDALGTNAITLSGADAASFEIDGRGLYLKAGVVLDFETKPSYAVTVGVADASLVGSGPISTSFTLGVTDVPEVSLPAPASAIYRSGDTIPFVVTYDRAVTLVGSAVLSLDVGGTNRTITLVGSDRTGSAATLTFNYVVQPGDNDASGPQILGLSLSEGSTLKDAANAAVDMPLSLPPVSMSGVQIDTVPTVVSLGLPDAKTYVAGDNLTFTVTLTEPVAVVGSPVLRFGTSGPGGATWQAAYDAGSSTPTVLKFSRSVQPDDEAPAGVAIYDINLGDGVTIRDLDLGPDDANLALPTVDASGIILAGSPLNPPAITSLALQTDSGLYATDRVTNAADLVGTASGTKLLAALNPSGTPSYTDIGVTPGVDGSFTITRAMLDALAGGTLADGVHTVSLVAADDADSRSEARSITFTLDTTKPSGGTLRISAADALDTDGTQTASAVLTLIGTVDAGASVTVTGPHGSIAALAGPTGGFRVPGVSLNVGENAFSVVVADAAGNTADAALPFSFTRLEQSQSDAVLEWNSVALAAIRKDVTDPPVATRTLAMVAIAQLDTLNAISGTPAFLVQQTVTGAVNAQAAAAAAAHRILATIYPAQKATLDAELTLALNTVTDATIREASRQLGVAVADKVYQARQNDGSTAFSNYSGSNAVGKWQKTGPMFEVPDQPHWKGVTPFAIVSASAFRPAAPPALGSADYATAYNDTKDLGSATSATRTADQTELALFWADGKGSFTPPGHWNTIAATVAQAQGNSLSANALLFAKLNVALADTAIACWDAKYTYETWRPETAIQQGAADGNAATAADAAWRPLLISPAHPEYVSGHSSFSAAAATVLTSLFGDAVSFDTTSPTLLGVTKSYTSFSQAATDAGRSRIYGGIHFEFSNQAGQAIGRGVADAVLAKFAVGADTSAP